MRGILEMNDVFFNKVSIHAGLVRHNSENIRSERIAKAQQGLDTLKMDIDRRQQKLDEVLAFLNQKKMEHQRLCKQYITNPEQANLAKELSHLQQGITHLEEKIKNTQPEKIQADLNIEYEKLKNVLALKIRF